MGKSKVTIVKGPQGTADSQAEIDKLLDRTFELLGGVDALISPEKKVVLKPNAGHAEPPETSVCTNPEVVRAVIREVKKANPKQI